MIHRGQILIREYMPEDKDKLRDIAKACFEEDIIYFIDQPQTVFAYTAIVEDEIQGTVFAWKNEFHPYCTYFRILTVPSSHHEGYRKELLDVLKKQVGERKIDHLPLQTSIWETAVGLGKLYKQNHFKKLRKTYTPLLHVADCYDPIPLEAKSSVQTIEEIIKDDVLKKDLVQLVKRNYTLTHLDNPVSATTQDGAWEKVTFASDLIEKGSVVYIDENNNQVLAYSLLHASGQESTFELGWCGTRDEAEETLVSQLVQHQILYAKKHGIEKLMGEFDTTDEKGLELLASFPFAPSPTWVTYSLKL